MKHLKIDKEKKYFIRSTVLLSLIFLVFLSDKKKSKKTNNKQTEYDKIKEKIDTIDLNKLNNNKSKEYQNTINKIESAKLEAKEDEKSPYDKNKNIKSKTPKTSKKIFNRRNNEKKIKKTKIPKKKKSEYDETLKKAPYFKPVPIIHEKDRDILEEKSGFGWKGQGSRRIVYNKVKKEYIYEVIEPSLSEAEFEQKNKLKWLFKKYTDIDIFDFTTTEKQQVLMKTLDKLIEENDLEIDDESKDRIYYYIIREFLGYGRIDIVMHDDGIEDISCDGYGIPVFIYHKSYESIKSNIIYDDADELDSFVVKLAQICGKQISVYEPVVDGKLYDGSRLQTTLGRTITMRSTFTIRRFRDDPLTPVDLVANNTMSDEMAAYFWLAIEKGCSILFCGGTAAGKTTMLNALSLFVPAAFKIVSIEDTREINLPHENWIAGTTRTGFTTSDANKTGRDIDMYDLIRVALRQRPRVIIVGEVRGKEAYTLFQAMTTGHLSYSTVHASDMHSLIQRLENPPIDLPRALLTSLDLIVFLNSATVNAQPVRRITNVTEVIKLDPETNRLVTLTPFYWVSEVEDRFQNTGGSRILHRIKMQMNWNDDDIRKDLQKRMKVINWMKKNNLRSYDEVGKIVAQYIKDPESVLSQVKEDSS